MGPQQCPGTATGELDVTDGASSPGGLGGVLKPFRSPVCRRAWAESVPYHVRTAPAPDRHLVQHLS